MKGTIYLRTLCNCSQHFCDQEWPPPRVYVIPIFRPVTPMHDADASPPGAVTITRTRIFELYKINPGKPPSEGKPGELPSAHYRERFPD